LEGRAKIPEGPRQRSTSNNVWQATLDIEPTFIEGPTIVQANLDDDESSFERMEKIFVLPGKPNSIEISTSGKAHMLGHGSIGVLLQIKDQFGNFVADGTPVSLSVTGSAKIDGEKLTTVDGIATAIVRGGEQPDPNVILTAFIEDVRATQALEIEPLELTLSGAGSFKKGDVSKVTALVTAGGVPVSGVPIDLYATHGAVDNNSLVSGADGTAETNLLHLRPGDGSELKASLGTSVFSNTPFEVTYNDDGEGVIESVDTVVVGDRSVDGTRTFDRYDNVQIEYPYLIRSPFSVQGADTANAGDSIRVSLGDMSDPNLSPLGYWSMSSLTPKAPSEVKYDFSLAANSEENIATDPQQLEDENGFSATLQFEPVAQNPPLNQSSEDNPEPTVLLNMAEAIKLLRTPDGTATLEANIDGTIIEIPLLVELTGEHQIEAHLVDGVLSFTVDNVREEIDFGTTKLTYDSTKDFSLSAPIDNNVEIVDLVFDVNPEKSVRIADVVDETGLHMATTQNVAAIEDNPMKVGTSYEFSDNGTLNISASDSLLPNFGLGVRFDFKLPNRLDISKSKTILDIAGGLQLQVEPSGLVTLQATTEDNSVTLLGGVELPDPIGPIDMTAFGDGSLSEERWHTLAIRYLNDKLTLSIDGVETDVDLTGAFQYSLDSNITLSAPGQTIRYNSFRIYDWRSAPLLSLAELGATNDGIVTSTAVDLGTDKRVSLDIISEGNLNKNQVGSSIQMLRVPILSGELREYVSVVSSDYYENISDLWIEIVATEVDGVPPIQVGSINSNYPNMMGAVDFLISPANAFSLSFAWSAINFFVPIEDVGRLGAQLYYLATGDDRFSTEELIFAALGTLTVLPFAKPLIPVLRSLKSFLRIGRQVRPEFYNSAAGPFGRAVKSAFLGKTLALAQWLPVIYILGEMAFDEDSRGSLLALLNTISSENDLNAWIEYLSLPTNGWEGEGVAVAEVPLESDEDQTALLNKNKTLFQQVGGLLIDDTVAAPRIGGLRAKGEDINKLINTVARKGKISDDEAKEIVNGIQGISHGLRQLKNKEYRGLAHTPQLLKVSTIAAGRGFGNMLIGFEFFRVPPAVTIGVLAYIESRIQCEPDPGLPFLATCDPFVPVVEGSEPNKTEFVKQLRTKYAAILRSAATKPDDDKIGGLLSNSHGALFELIGLTYFQLSYELIPGNPKPIALEQETKIDIKFDKSKAQPDRQTDIVLEETDGTQRWVELKSLQKQTIPGKTKLEWDGKSVGNGKSRGLHGAYTLDCLANIQKKSSSFIHYFQDFKRNLRTSRRSKKKVLQQGPEAKKLKTIREVFRTKPKGLDDSQFKTSTNNICTQGNVSDIKLFNAKTLLTGSPAFANVLFDGLNGNALDELFK